jgi:hypothetical protein
VLFKFDFAKAYNKVFLGFFVWNDGNFWDGKGVHTHGLHFIFGSGSSCEC